MDTNRAVGNDVSPFSFGKKYGTFFAAMEHGECSISLKRAYSALNLEVNQMTNINHADQPAAVFTESAALACPRQPSPDMWADFHKRSRWDRLIHWLTAPYRLVKQINALVEDWVTASITRLFLFWMGIVALLHLVFALLIKFLLS